MSGLEDQLRTRMERRPPTQSATEKADELIARSTTPVPRRERPYGPIIDPPVEMSPPSGERRKEARLTGDDAAPPRKRRAAPKTKTTFGLTEEAVKAKRAIQHWCLDRGVPMDSVVSELLVLFVRSDTVQEAIASDLEA